MPFTIHFVDRFLTAAFYKLGLAIARHPGYFLLIPIFVTVICGTGFQRIYFETDSEFLFSPINGTAKSERNVVESLFPTNYSARFNPSRITRPGRFGRLLVTPKDGNNMLFVNIWKELRVLNDLIANATIEFGVNNQKYKYEDICAKWMDDCFPNDILNLDFVMSEVENGKLNLSFPVMLNPITWDVHTFPLFFGGINLADDKTILSVPCVQLLYFIATDKDLEDKRGAVWENKFLETIADAEETNLFDYISVARFTSHTLDNELEKNMRSVTPYFATTFFLMALFSVVTCMMFDCVRSKPMLGLLGNASAAMGTVAAFGFAIYCGVPFIGINFVSPFLMFSIGIDDTFIMLAAWRKTSPTTKVPERLARTMSESAVSITITSVTNIVSLYIGHISPFPAIKIFCIYSGFAVFFIFCWHITFFAACMAMYGYLEQKNRHSLTCLPVLPQSLSHRKSWIYRILCSGGINRSDSQNVEDNGENCWMGCFRDSLGSILNNCFVKLTIMILLSLYLAGSIYGVSRIKEGLQRNKLSKTDSYSIEYYNREDAYFRTFSYRIQVVISDSLDYSDPDIQTDLENLITTFEASPFISTSLYTESWMRSFNSYLQRNHQNWFDNAEMNADLFLRTLQKEWLFSHNPFSLDVKFDENTNKITASRFIIQAVNITDTNVEQAMLRDLRRIAKESKLNVTVFHPYFIYFDQFELVKPVCIQSMIIGVATMTVISFLFVPSLLCSLWIAISIISIELGVIGYMALWDVNLDTISMINLIMCVGFSIDFTAHICYAYTSSTAKTPRKRIDDSLYSVGFPILQGALSTLIGIGALLFAGSYIFLVFFKMMFLVIVFGALHGLFILPVLLSLFDSRCCTTQSEVDDFYSKKAKPFAIPHPLLRVDRRKCRSGALRGMDLPRGELFVIPTYYVATTKLNQDNQEKDLGIGTSEDTSDSSVSKFDRKNNKISRNNTRKDNASVDKKRFYSDQKLKVKMSEQNVKLRNQQKIGNRKNRTTCESGACCYCVSLPKQMCVNSFPR